MGGIFYIYDMFLPLSIDSGKDSAVGWLGGIVSHQTVNLECKECAHISIQ